MRAGDDDSGESTIASLHHHIVAWVFFMKAKQNFHWGEKKKSFKLEKHVYLSILAIIFLTITEVAEAEGEEGVEDDFIVRRAKPKGAVEEA